MNFANLGLNVAVVSSLVGTEKVCGHGGPRRVDRDSIGNKLVDFTLQPLSLALDVLNRFVNDRQRGCH